MESNLLSASKRCPLFSGLDDVDIEQSLSGVGYRIVGYEKHDVYALAGMPCRYADIVVTGTLVCRMASLSGKQVEVSRLRAGDIVAPAFIFANDKSMPVSVETDEATTVLRLQPAMLQEMLDTDGRIRMNFIRVLSNIDVFLTQKMKVLSLFTVREKVAYFLLERMGEQGSDVVRLHRSRQEIADSFGIQKFSLLRVLSDFEKKGAIKINGREITILDKNGLRAMT